MALAKTRHAARSLAMLRDGAVWFGVDGASEVELNELREVAPRKTPETLYALLAHSNGGEGALPVSPLNFVLDDAHTIAEFIRARPYGDVLDGFLIFGGNGGGEFVALDLRAPDAAPVVEIDMVAGPASAGQIAPSLEAFIPLISFES